MSYIRLNSLRAIGISMIVVGVSSCGANEKIEGLSKIIEGLSKKIEGLSKKIDDLSENSVDPRLVEIINAFVDGVCKVMKNPDVKSAFEDKFNQILKGIFDESERIIKIIEAKNDDYAEDNENRLRLLKGAKAVMAFKPIFEDFKKILMNSLSKDKQSSKDGGASKT